MLRGAVKIPAGSLFELYMSKTGPIKSHTEEKYSTIMTLLTYSPGRHDYKLDTYQDTCVKQLMAVETKEAATNV